MHMYVVPLWFGNSGIIFFPNRMSVFILYLKLGELPVMEVELFWRSVFLHYY